MPTSTYGGPKVDEETLTVTSATLSADRKKVTLKIDGLKPGRVVYVRSPRPFDAQDGESLWSTEAWYTLNKLPGLRRAGQRRALRARGRPAHRRREVRHRPRRLHRHRVRRRLRHRRRGATKFDVNAAKAGDYRLALRYANGPNPFARPEDGEPDRQRHEPPDHAARDGIWTNYRLYLDDVALNAGANTIEIKHADGRRRPRQPRLAAARSRGHDALRGRGGDARRRRDGPDRARRLQRHGLRRRLPEPGCEHDVQGERVRRRRDGGHARLRQRPGSVPGKR